jgi:hypothetical protein
MSDSEPTVDAKAEEAAAADAGGLNNRKRRSYTAALKLEVVKIAKQSSLQAASKLFNIDRHMIRSWRADEEKLKLFKFVRKRAFVFFLVFPFNLKRTRICRKEKNARRWASREVQTA